MQQQQHTTSSAASEINKAKMAAIERGERLGELEEASGRLALGAEAFGGMAAQLKNKYNKKWWQL